MICIHSWWADGCSLLLLLTQLLLHLQRRVVSRDLRRHVFWLAQPVAHPMARHSACLYTKNTPKISTLSALSISLLNHAHNVCEKFFFANCSELNNYFSLPKNSPCMDIGSCQWGGRMPKAAIICAWFGCPAWNQNVSYQFKKYLTTTF
jgi:hypothetical protein